MATAFYRVGHVSVAQNSKVVTGTGTTWTKGANKIYDGDVFLCNNKLYEIEHVISDTEIHLFSPFQDPDITNQAYAIMRNASLNISSRIAASVAIAINQKQQQLNEFNSFLTSTAATVNMTDTIGNVIAVIPIPTLVKTINDLVNNAAGITTIVNEGKTARDQAVAANSNAQTALRDVRTIKGEVEQLKSNVEGLKTDTEGFKNSASSSASAAAGSATAAAAEVTKAQDEVQHAKDQVVLATSQARAAATSESNAGASATAASKSAQLAQAAIVPMRNEAEMWEMIRRNKDLYAANQFVDFGNHYYSATAGNGQNINEGLWARSKDAVSANCLFMNRSEAATPSGSSKVPFALTTVAGFVSQLYGFNWHSQHVCNTILFPEAPDGTVIYDSTGNARGTSKANLDLLNEVDPKYGNAAKDHGGKNEAIFRAFEGASHNNNFRYGDTHWALFGGASITNGKLTISGAGSYAHNSLYHVAPNRDYIVEIVCDRDTVSNVDIIIYSSDATKAANITRRLHAGNNVIRVSSSQFSQNYGSTNILRVGNKEAVISSAIVRPTSEQAVITPHDVFGMEFWLEEVTQAEPDVFDCGMVQSKATSSNGVATSASSRPQTYHAVFKGDTTTGHTSVNFFTATFEQQCKLAAKEENNLFRLNDGRIVQWRGRQKTFRGMGNGNWQQIDPEGEPNGYGALKYYSIGGVEGRIAAQGKRDDSNIWTGDTVAQYRDSLAAQNDGKNKGIFQVHNGNGTAASDIPNQCFFQVWGEVPRFNDAAFHETLNPMGTAAFAWRDSANGQVAWHSNVAAKPAISTLDCFIESTSGGSKTTNPDSGAISDSFNARDDRRKYDAIYPSGLGGVIDYRVSAHDMGSKEEAAKVFQKVVNDTYRGKEKLPYFTPDAYQPDTDLVGYFYASPTSDNRHGLIYSPELRRAYLDGDARTGDYFFITNGQEYVGGRFIRYNGASNQSDFTDSVSSPAMPRDKALKYSDGWRLWMVKRSDLNASVSGEFTMTDGVGNPLKLILDPDMRNGWPGSWSPDVPDGTISSIRLSRKSLSKKVTRKWRSSPSGNWNSGELSVNPTADTIPPWASGEYGLITYTAIANVTKPSSLNKVLNDVEGMGEVWSSHYFDVGRGVFFAESMMGKVLTSAASPHSDIKPLTRKLLLDSSFIPLDDYLNSHYPIELPAPTNESPAIKAVWSQASNNQQATLQFNWNELVWSNEHSRPDKFVGANGEVDQAYIVGRTYRIYNASPSSGVWQCLKSVTTTINGAYWNPVGDKLIAADGVAWFRRWTGNGWGDDSTIRIKDGIGTFINLNGDTCLYGTSELAIPYGYTKNQARAGSQVAGVDL